MCLSSVHTASCEHTNIHLFSWTKNLFLRFFLFFASFQLIFRSYCEAPAPKHSHIPTHMPTALWGMPSLLPYQTKSSSKIKVFQAAPVSLSSLILGSRQGQFICQFTHDVSVTLLYWNNYQYCQTSFSKVLHLEAK